MCLHYINVDSIQLFCKLSPPIPSFIIIFAKNLTLRYFSRNIFEKERDIESVKKKTQLKTNENKNLTNKNRLALSWLLLKPFTVQLSREIILFILLCLLYNLSPFTQMILDDS